MVLSLLRLIRGQGDFKWWFATQDGQKSPAMQALALVFTNVYFREPAQCLYPEEIGLTVPQV